MLRQLPPPPRPGGFVEDDLNGELRLLASAIVQVCADFAVQRFPHLQAALESEHTLTDEQIVAVLNAVLAEREVQQ